MYNLSVESQKGAINTQRCSGLRTRRALSLHTKSMVIVPFWLSTDERKERAFCGGKCDSAWILSLLRSIQNLVQNLSPPWDVNFYDIGLYIAIHNYLLFVISVHLCYIEKIVVSMISLPFFCYGTYKCNSFLFRVNLQIYRPSHHEYVNDRNDPPPPFFGPSSLITTADLVHGENEN